MTEIDRTKEWTFEGKRLGYRRHVDPWSGGICWATVNLDTDEVVAVENSYSADGEHFAVAASCMPHMLNVPPDTLKGDEFRKREAVLTGHDPGPSPYWQNQQTVSNVPEPDGTGDVVENGGDREARHQAELDDMIKNGIIEYRDGEIWLTERYQATLNWASPARKTDHATENGGDHIYGIRYPGDDGSESEDVRDRKAEEYAAFISNEIKAATQEPHSRWAFFTTQSISLIGAMFYVTIGFLIGAYLFW